MTAFAGKAGAIAIEVADGKLGPAFLRQPAQQSIRFLTSSVDWLLFGQALDLRQVVIHQC